MMIYINPSHPGSKISFKSQYENFIGGKWVPPVKGQYFDNVTPITGKPFCKIPRSTAEDIELALDAAHAAKVERRRVSRQGRRGLRHVCIEPGRGLYLPVACAGP